jgi:hypothetical protein
LTPQLSGQVAKLVGLPEGRGVGPAL